MNENGMRLRTRSTPLVLGVGAALALARGILVDAATGTPIGREYALRGARKTHS